MFAEPLMASLRALLTRLDYSRAALERITGVTDPLRGPGPDPAGVVKALDGGGALGTVAACLWLGLPLEASRLAGAIAPMTVEQWQRGGLLVASGDRWRAAVMVVPWADLWLLTDRPPGPGGSPPDHVMAVGAGTEILRAIMVERPGGRVLDLGAGCGSLSMLAGRFASEVRGIELNPRGVVFARAAAQLNDLPTCRFEVGSYFELDDEPADADLVICQPPFVISPSRDLMFRDADRGDESVWRAVRVAAGQLSAGGIAELVINWTQKKGDDPFVGARQALLGVGCDVFLAHSKIQAPADYASDWLEDEADRPAWLAYYEELGIEAICSGVAVLRKRAQGRGWRHFTELPQTMSPDAQAHVVQILDGHDVIERSSRADLLALRPRQREHLRATPTQTVSEAGLHYTVDHDPLTAAIVECCDGETTLRAMAETIAVGHGLPLEGSTEMLLRVVGTFISHGLLLP